MIVVSSGIRADAVRIDLTVEQQKRAILKGVNQRWRAIRLDRREPYGKCRNPWDAAIEGAGGEQSGSIYYSDVILLDDLVDNVRPDGVKLADARCGDRFVEFRTRLNLKWQLFVNLDDADDRAYVLIVGRIPTFWIQGWLFGYEAKADLSWLDSMDKIHAPAFFPPTDVLHPPETLKDWLRCHADLTQ